MVWPIYKLGDTNLVDENHSQLEQWVTSFSIDYPLVHLIQLCTGN